MCSVALCRSSQWYAPSLAMMLMQIAGSVALAAACGAPSASHCPLGGARLGFLSASGVLSIALAQHAVAHFGPCFAGSTAVRLSDLLSDCGKRDRLWVAALPTGPGGTWQQEMLSLFSVCRACLQPAGSSNCVMGPCCFAAVCTCGHAHHLSATTGSRHCGVPWADRLSPGHAVQSGIAALRNSCSTGSDCSLHAVQVYSHRAAATAVHLGRCRRGHRHGDIRPGLRQARPLQAAEAYPQRVRAVLPSCRHGHRHSHLGHGHRHGHIRHGY